jgi:molybdopterin-guanine dinucleotide biosynthesis protein A
MSTGQVRTPAAPARSAGLVLAGGASRRMGSDKALLRIGSERLVDRQVRILREAVGDTVFVGLPFGDAVAWPPPSGAIVVRDSQPDCGPLAGIVAGIEAADAGLLAVVAVDLPRIDSDWIRSLLNRCRPGVGAVPVVEGRLEPLAAAYPRGALSSARVRLQSGRLSVQEWAREGLEAGWLEPWILTAGEAEILLNWNRPQDWSPA